MEHPPPRKLCTGASFRIALGKIPHSQFQIREGIDLFPWSLDPPPPASQAGDVFIVHATSDGADGHAKCQFGRIIDLTIASTPVAALLAYCSEFGGAGHFAWSLSPSFVYSRVVVRGRFLCVRKQAFYGRTKLDFILPVVLLCCLKIP